ncbi:FG-GAP-like repeat-containing protein [Streptomyces odontomachi]|uniref:FG-GAP-like repeat-containing protein n=1 Tax=Streptomyces odontomachi TaxID=2944940 RepID=UPI00210C195D|nr:FG-GAP-like repeat-containing protein [Streptomyces sp. ODS25]
MDARGAAHARGLVVMLTVGLSVIACTVSVPGSGTGEGLPGWCADGTPATSTMSASARHPDGPRHDDFNGDGYSDVALPVPNTTVEHLKQVPVTELGTGYVAVLYGSASGLRASSKRLIHQNGPGIVGTAERGDGFGTSVTTADLDRDGYADLVVGSGGEDSPVDPRTNNVVFAGALTVVWGGPHGLSGSAALPSRAEPGDGVGWTVVAGDFNGDGAPDLATRIGSHDDLRLLTGPFGRDGTPAGGVHDVRGPRNAGGIRTMAAGDTNGDGITDLAAVSTGDGTVNGLVHWPGSHQGLTSGTLLTRPDGSRVDVAGTVATGDVNGDGYDDIVADDDFQYVDADGGGVAGDGDVDRYGRAHHVPNIKAGAVVYVPGGGSGPDTGHITTYNQDTPGVPGVAEEEETPDGDMMVSDDFGAALSVADIDGDGLADLAVGVPNENDDRGRVVIMRGTAHGPTGEGAQTLGEGTRGVAGAAVSGGRFGAAVRLVDTGNDGRADLLVGAPQQGKGAETRDDVSGAAWQFLSAACGVTTRNALHITPRTLSTPTGHWDWIGADFNS